MKKYKVCWITLCKNEIDILPFVSKYWERIADKVVVFDNDSTDGSLEFLAKLPYVEIRHFDSDGQNDPLQKKIKEEAYLEYKDKYDVVIISDMDEIFYADDMDGIFDDFFAGGYAVLAFPIVTLCENSKPNFDASLLLHQQCHMYYKQKMNHTIGFEEISKFSIFNTKVVEAVNMSVGQHYVQTLPTMKILIHDDGFCLHLDKGFGWKYFCDRRKKMGDNLSETNKRGGMCFEYLKSENESRNEYLKKQEKSFDINDYFNSNNKS